MTVTITDEPMLNHTEADRQLERIIRWGEITPDIADAARSALNSHFQHNSRITELHLMSLVLNGMDR